MEKNTRQLECAIDCIVKHGEKYPHAAIQHIELIKQHLESGFLYCFNDRHGVNEIEAEVWNAIASVVAGTRSKLETIANNNDTAPNPYADAKYALHLLDRLHASPWDENELILAEARFCYEKLVKYEAAKANGGALRLPVIHEIRSAKKAVETLIEMLNNQLNPESAEDVYNVMQTQCYLLGKLAADSVPPSMLEVFWEQFDPSIYAGDNQKLQALFETTREVIEDMHDNSCSPESCPEEWYTAGLRLLSTAIHCELRLAQYSGYTAILRRIFAYCKRGLEMTMADMLSVIYRDKDGSDKLWASRLLREASELLAELKTKSHEKACAHITLNMTGAMEFCGVYSA